MIPFDLKMDLTKALKQSPEFKAAYDTEEVTRELIDTALILEDITRNASVHAAGVVIGDQPLVNLLPLKQDDSGTLVTQYAMNPVGELGLLKMDFLGLKTLTVIRNTCEWSNAHTASRCRLTICRSMTQKPMTCSIARKRSACSSWKSGGMPICAASFKSVPSNTSRRWWRFTGPARWN